MDNRQDLYEVNDECRETLTVGKFTSNPGDFFFARCCREKNKYALL